jgi:hypothetical protein
MEQLTNRPISNTSITAFQIAEAKPSYCFNACASLNEKWHIYHAT